MKILLTGASGFIGRRLCERYLLEGHTVLAPVRRAYTLAAHQNLLTYPLDDICHSVNWREMLQGVDAVIHLAAAVHHKGAGDTGLLDLYRAVNLHASKDLAEAAVEAGVKRFVYVSTAKVNGEETVPNRAFTELDAPAPVGAYSVSKWEAEQALRAITKNAAMELTIVRPPLVYGPEVRANFLAMIGVLSKGYPLPFAKIENRRSLVSRENLVDFLMLCAAHPKAANETFFVSDGEDISTANLLEKLSLALGKEPRLWAMPQGVLKLLARVTGQMLVYQRLVGSLQVDISKAGDLLAWQPSCKMDEALLETARYYINYGYINE